MMMDIFNILTERRIQEAIARGDFKNLSGSGKPLKIENLYFLPRKLRAAYLVLKNSGYLNQASQENDCISLPAIDDLNLHNPSISKQELSEKVFNHNVMMDCRRRR
ncbi:MAG: DUF1992 domain-containing protein [Desulfosporosinus sp.]|nr:DUF1992 domain-containing protein [Desulfosporosinus sp.]